MAKWGEIKCASCATLEERLKAALQDADEAEAYTEELEAKLAQQDDLVQAAVEAALREAINRVNGCDRVSEVQPAILALIRKGGE